MFFVGFFPSFETQKNKTKAATTKSYLIDILLHMFVDYTMTRYRSYTQYTHNINVLISSSNSAHGTKLCSCILTFSRNFCCVFLFFVQLFIQQFVVIFMKINRKDVWRKKAKQQTCILYVSLKVQMPKHFQYFHIFLTK